WCDHPYVLGPVQLPGRIFGRAVEADGEDPGAEVVGKLVVVVPAVGPGLVPVAVRTDPKELDVVAVAALGELADAHGSPTGVELERKGGAVGEGDGLGLEPGALFHPPAVAAPSLFHPRFGGGDAIDRKQAEVAQQGLVMDAA